MFVSKLKVNRYVRELVKEVRRDISKTATDKRSDAISRGAEQKIQLENVTGGDRADTLRRWSKQMQHNNIRVLSTIQQVAATRPQSSSLVSKEQSRDFMALFPDLVRDLTEVGRNKELPEVMKKFAKVLQYNTPRGKKTRGLIVLSAYKMLEDPIKVTADSIKLAGIVGWCLEMLHAYFLIVDDIMDQSDTRRGFPCWYKLPEVGLTALNDAIMVEGAIFVLLKKYLRDHPMYVPIMELFHDTNIKTMLGQSLDTMCLDSEGKPRLDMFTMSRYTAIIKYKTAQYSFYAPVGFAMYLAGISDEEQHRQARTILLEIGELFQIQDDFLDCFGDPVVIGKNGTDIQDGKCSWLATMALARASPAQRKIIEEHYGRKDPESIQLIKNLYIDLSLPNTYAAYEEETYNLIRTHIQQVSKGLPHDIFFMILDRIYKRDS